jgi:hypothetical protein
VVNRTIIKYPAKEPDNWIFKPLKGPLTVVRAGRDLYNRKAGIIGTKMARTTKIVRLAISM